jgi:hypothetical protein
MPGSISFRRWIRWLQNAESEPTDTIVLTGMKTGVFLDVRFLKRPPKGGTAEETTEELDWAFAGYRTSDGNHTKFVHYIDSRTLVRACLRN